MVGFRRAAAPGRASKPRPGQGGGRHWQLIGGSDWRCWSKCGAMAEAGNGARTQPPPASVSGSRG